MKKISYNEKSLRKKNINMIIVNPSIEFIWMTPDPLKQIEKAGRICYQSEHKITENSYLDFIKKILSNNHLAVIEHASISYKIISDRGVMNEVVRHRLFSYCQESTRYCQYSEKISVIRPPGLKDLSFEIWKKTMADCEDAYINLIKNGISAQIARSVLPLCLKTELIMTGNFREWLHFLSLRSGPAAHPQIRQICGLLLDDIKKRVPIIFDQSQ